MSAKHRPLNGFVHCTCGVTYISGYLNCPKCGISKSTLVTNVEKDKASADKEFADAVTSKHIMSTLTV